MNVNKILTLMGFASKAGKLSYGFDPCVDAVKQKKSKLVLCAEDLSAKSLKEITFHCEKTGVEILTLKSITIDVLSHAVGHRCGIVSINDNGFAKSLSTVVLKEEIANDQ